MKETGDDLTIGALAQAAQVGVETIRFYQRCGLMRAPARPRGGIRRYRAPDLARVRFIKSAQRLGFSLQEVAELLTLEDGTECRVARSLAERKLDEVRAKRAALRKMESALRALVDQCRSARGTVACPLISSLHQRTRVATGGQITDK